MLVSYQGNRIDSGRRLQERVTLLLLLSSSASQPFWIRANFSSARTTKRFSSPRRAPAIQIVRPRESTAETQPQLQPALLRLSAMISHYFMESLQFSSPDEFPTPRNLLGLRFSSAAEPPFLSVLVLSGVPSGTQLSSIVFTVGRRLRRALIQ